MITKIFNKTIAVFLTAIFIFGLFPAAVFTQPNPPSSLGEVKGFNRSVFDSHFSRADREISPERWLAEAKLGVSQALYAWELTASRLYEDPQAFEEEKSKVEKWSDEELEKRFSQWLIGRFFGKTAEKALMNLSSSLGEIQKNYSWRLDEEGNIVFDDKTGDPLIIRPDEEGRDFSRDFLLWRSDADEIVRKSGASFDTTLLNLYPELFDYIPGEMRETLLATISETGASISASVKREFENIAAREERIFTSRRTRDIWSLRKKSEDGSARLFTEKLTAETEEACRQGIEELTVRIEQAEAGTGDLALMGEEWLRLYREQFEKGLKAWEEAEERFFIRRIEWEQESFRLFSEGEETWFAAFNQFEEERQKWELKAKELFQSGEALFKNVSEDFQRTIADAKKEFEINMEMRIGAGTNKVKALIDMYLVCASAAVSARNNIVFWMKNYGISSDKNPADSDFTEWLLDERKSIWEAVVDKYTKNNVLYKQNLDPQIILYVQDIIDGKKTFEEESAFARQNKNTFILESIFESFFSFKNNIFDYDKFEKIVEIHKSYDIYSSYLEKALDARDRILADYAELIGTGTLKDILSPDSSTEDFCLDEYQIALVRAKALVLYWERKTKIAEAVTSYAEELSAGRMTEAEGIRAWEDAKAAYNESLVVYESELKKLNELGENVYNQQEILSRLSGEMQLVEEKLNKLNSDYSIFVNISAVNRADYYLKTLNEKYDFLVEDYKLFLKAGADAVYRTALEYGLNWSLSKQREDAESVLNILINGDEETISLTELEDEVSRGLISETELKIRLAGIDLFYDADNGELRPLDSDYSGADWYAAAKGLYLSDEKRASLYGDNLTAQLVSDYKNASRLLLEKRLEFELDALINFLKEDHGSGKFNYATSEFYLLDADTAAEAWEVLSNLEKRMERGLNVYTENDEENELISSFISGVSFFECSREILAEYFDEYSVCAGLLDLYIEYEAVSSFGQKEAWNIICNSLSSLLTDYGIKQTENFLPNALSIFEAIGKMDGDVVQNAAQFLKDFDNCFTITPQWLEYEKENWKYAFMQLAAAYIFHSGISPEKSSSDIYFEQEELYSQNEELYLYAYSLNFMEDDEMENLNSAFTETRNNYLLLDYMGQITMFLDTFRYEETAAEGERHWRNFLNGKDLLNSDPAITVVSAWEKGVLADALFCADYYTNRINDSFTLFSKRDSTETGRNSALNINLYLEEASRLSRKFSSLEYQYSDIANISRAYEFTQLELSEINEQMKLIINEISAQEAEYNAVRDKYFIAVEEFMTSGFLYDEHYNILKTAYNNTDQYRFNYEKQDAIKKWASTAYLDKETIDPEYCKTKLVKAQTVMDVLSNIYNNESNRSYNDPQYNALYSEYEQSFGIKLKILEAYDSFLLSASEEKNRNESILALYKDSLNSLGYVDKNYTNYALPAEMKAWTVKDFITVKDGKLAFIEKGTVTLTLLSPITLAPMIFHSIKLSGVDDSTAADLNEFFSSDNSHLSAFEESLLALSWRMSEYFSDDEKLIKWGLARDYLIYSLKSGNGDITYLKDHYIGPGMMTADGDLGKLQVKPGVGLFDYARDLYKLLVDLGWANSLSNLFSTPNQKLENSSDIYRKAYEELSDEERTDLEYYVILALSGSGYSEGFSRMYTLSAYEIAYNYVNNKLKYAQRERNKAINFLLFGAYDNMISINKHALKQIKSAYYGTMEDVNNWINGIKRNLSSIQNYAASYKESYEKLAVLKVENENGQSIVWDDISKALNYVLKEEKVDEIRVYWEKMQETSSGNFSNITDALTGLFLWAKNMEDNSRKNLETFWQYSVQERLNNEYNYQAAVEAYMAGTGNADDLTTAAENAFGKNTAAWKNHLTDMHTILMNDLSLYMNTDKDFYGEFSAIGNELVILTEKTLTNRYSAEFAAREIEWDFMLRDIQDKYSEWLDSAALIFENGRADWSIGFQKMQEAYGRWAVNFENEYNRVNEEWTIAYLAGLEDKERWLEQAAAAADRASEESFLSLMGTEGERLSRLVDTREPHGIRDALPQAQNLITELLQSSGIVNMANAFSSINNISSTVSTVVRRGMGGVSSWDAALVKSAATDLARTTNAEVADAEAKKLAYTARSNANQIINSLSANVQSANQNFRKSMDNTFITNGLWRRSGNNYVKDITKGSTLFTPVISETVTITGYANYIMEPISIQTNLDENFLSTLDSYTIHGLIENVLEEVNAYRDEIFGAEKGEPRDVGRQGSSKEKRTQSPGKFGAYIGYNPDTKSDFKDIKRELIFYDEGAGELGRLLADFIYWDIVDRKGKAEQALPDWDKRMWDDTGSSFKAPTIRSVGQIAGAIAAAVFTGGTSLIAIGTAILLNSASDIVFGTLDAALGYKTGDEAGFEMGKSLLINTTSSLIGAGTNYLSSTIKTSSSFGNAALKGATSAVGSYTTSVASSYINAYDFKTGEMDWETANSSWYSANTIASTASAGVSSGLGSYLSNPNVISNAQQKFLGGAINLAAAGSAELAKYGVYTAYNLGSGMNLGDSVKKAYDDMDGLTINILNMGSIFDIIAGGIARNNNDGQPAKSASGIKLMGNLKNTFSKTGLLEMNFGSGGITSRIGTGGIDVGGALYDLTKRGIDYSRMQNIENERIRNIAMSTYINGDWTAENTSMRITSGLDDLQLYSEHDKIGYTILKDGGKGRVISILDSGNDKINAIYLQHEAYRNGIVTDDNSMETKLATWAHTEMARKMNLSWEELSQNENLVRDMIAYNMGMDFFNAYVDGNYDSSADYWKLMRNGTLVNNNSGWLTDEDGKPILNENDERIGAGGIETGLLNILFGGTHNVGYDEYSDEQIRLVQGLMISAHMNYHSEVNGDIRTRYWTGNAAGQPLNIQYTPTQTKTTQPVETSNVNTSSRLDQFVSWAKDSARSIYNGARNFVSSARDGLKNATNTVRNWFSPTRSLTPENNQIDRGNYVTVPEDFFSNISNDEIRYKYSKEKNNGVAQCNTYVKDMVLEYFGSEVHRNIFEGKDENANAMFLSFRDNPYLERINPFELDGGLQAIQQMADDGYLILLSTQCLDKDENGNRISGHIAFIGTSNLTFSTNYSEAPDYNGKTLADINRPDLNEIHLVVVQAGVFPGITSIRWATTGWLNPTKRDNLLRNDLYFYRVRSSL
jgi:hypothetical protein